MGFPILCPCFTSLPLFFLSLRGKRKRRLDVSVLFPHPAAGFERLYLIAQKIDPRSARPKHEKGAGPWQVPAPGAILGHFMQVNASDLR
jgi:hypothetical protein